MHWFPLQDNIYNTGKKGVVWDHEKKKNADRIKNLPI